MSEVLFDMLLTTVSDVNVCSIDFCLCRLWTNDSVGTRQTQGLPCRVQGLSTWTQSHHSFHHLITYSCSIGYNDLLLVLTSDTVLILRMGIC